MRRIARGALLAFLALLIAGSGTWATLALVY
jgi:hypothetical protein